MKTLEKQINCGFSRLCTVCGYQLKCRCFNRENNVHTKRQFACRKCHTLFLYEKSDKLFNLYYVKYAVAKHEILHIFYMSESNFMQVTGFENNIIKKNYSFALPFPLTAKELINKYNNLDLYENFS